MSPAAAPCPQLSSPQLTGEQGTVEGESGSLCPTVPCPATVGGLDIPVTCDGFTHPAGVRYELIHSFGLQIGVNKDFFKWFT